jgi:Zn-finger nucleic acid-binding protein
MYELKTCSVCGATGLKRISTEQHDGQTFGVYKCPSCDAELSAYDKYLKELKKICKQGYDLLDENEELEGLLDDIVNLINSTLYKVKELAESHSYPDLKDYINEALIEEKKIEDLNGHSFDDICWYIEKESPDLNWHRELSNNSVIDVMEYYTIFDGIERAHDISYDDLYDYIEKYEKEFKKYLKNL